MRVVTFTAEGKILPQDALKLKKQRKTRIPRSCGIRVFYAD